MLWETKENTKYTLISLDFFISLPELRSMHVELYILKSKFGCHVPQSNLSYCHVNLVGDAVAKRSTHWFRYARISESPTKNIPKSCQQNILNDC